jgi:hypothetical protein
MAKISASLAQFWRSFQQVAEAPASIITPLLLPVHAGLSSSCNESKLRKAAVHGSYFLQHEVPMKCELRVIACSRARVRIDRVRFAALQN